MCNFKDRLTDEHQKRHCRICAALPLLTNLAAEVFRAITSFVPPHVRLPSNRLSRHFDHDPVLSASHRINLRRASLSFRAASIEL